ncbi:MAG: hypothetical protein M3375_00085 [Actinomycetota bacterium]|nr:hypothetical protein [Actinomycetota bacterium]
MAGFATLIGVPASHPTLAIQLRLEDKDVEYRRVDLVAHRPLLRLAGFPGITVPAVVMPARLGMPTGVAAATARPVVLAAARLNRASDEAIRRDLAALPGLLDHVDELIAEGVIGGEALNAADFQIAASVRLLLTMDDLRSGIERRPAGAHALRVAPHFPGRIPPVLPAA